MDELELIEEHGHRTEALRGLAVVRQTSVVNMHNIGGVKQVAIELGLDALVDLLDDLDEMRRRQRADVYMSYLEEMARRDEEGEL